MPNWQLYIALLVALIIGFWQGKRYQKKRQAPPQNQHVNQYYVKGLNYLLNEEPDAAIDIFIESLDVNSETLETHLALGKMLRKKGEVDRAIRIHQNLLARPGLSLDYSQQVEYELAMDFTKAGLYDRAESLLEKLAQQESALKERVLTSLLDIYREEKEWRQGLAILQQLAGSRFSKNYETWAPIRAQFSCELAQEALDKADEAIARQWIKQALAFDKVSARANIMLGNLEVASGNPKKGIQLLRRVVERSPEFLSEVLEPLASAYRQLGTQDKYLAYLRSITSSEPQVLLDITIANCMAEIEADPKNAIQYLSEQVKQNPSLKLLNHIIHHQPAVVDEERGQDLSTLQGAFERVTNTIAEYQCQKCGFEVRTMHWLCPSCKCWESIKYKNNQ